MKAARRIMNRLRVIKNPLNRRKGGPERRRGREELSTSEGGTKMFTAETSDWP